MTDHNHPDRGVALGGFMGAGKSTVGACLAEKMGLPFVDLDEQVAHAAGCAVTEIFETEGEEGFREREAAAVAEVVANGGRIVLALGGGTLHHGTNLKTLKKTFDVVCLHLSWDRIQERLNGTDDGSRPLIVDAARLYADRLGGYLQAGWWVDGDGEPAEVAQRVVERLAVR